MTLPLAQSGLSFLIYLIVGIFWLVGNLSQQKKAKQRAEEMRRQREEREREEARSGKKPRKAHPLERDLETLLGRLAGDPSPPPPTSAPPVKPRPVRGDIQFDQAPPPPLPTAARPAPAMPKPKRDAMELATSFKDIEDIQDAVEISYDQVEGELSSQNLVTVRQVMVDLSPTMIDFARLPVQRMRTTKADTTPPALKSRKGFKKAVLAGIILDAPVALQDPKANGR